MKALVSRNPFGASYPASGHGALIVSTGWCTGLRATTSRSSPAGTTTAKGKGPALVVEDADAVADGVQRGHHGEGLGVRHDRALGQPLPQAPVHLGGLELVADALVRRLEDFLRLVLAEERAPAGAEEVA